MNAGFRSVEISDPRFEREHLRWVTVKSPALRARADVTLCVPPQVESRRDVPVIILLHGVYGSHWAWAFKGGAHQTALEMIEAGELMPVVLAMPSDGMWGDGSGYVRHVHQDFERWIVEDVPTVVNEVIPQTSARSPLCIAGLSMGGFGAMRLGAKFGRQFRAISAHSSVTRLDLLKSAVEEDMSDFVASAEEQDVFTVIAHYRDTLPPLRFDCGTDDPLIKPNRALHKQLLETGVPHTFEEFEGAHNWAYWQAHLRDTLRFCARALGE